MKLYALVLILALVQISCVNEHGPQVASAAEVKVNPDDFTGGKPQI